MKKILLVLMVFFLFSPKAYAGSFDSEELDSLKNGYKATKWGMRKKEVADIFPRMKFRESDYLFAFPKKLLLGEKAQVSLSFNESGRFIKTTVVFDLGYCERNLFEKFERFLVEPYGTPTEKVTKWITAEKIEKFSYYDFLNANQWAFIFNDLIGTRESKIFLDYWKTPTAEIALIFPETRFRRPNEPGTGVVMWIISRSKKKDFGPEKGTSIMTKSIYEDKILPIQIGKHSGVINLITPIIEEGRFGMGLGLLSYDNNCILMEAFFNKREFPNLENGCKLRYDEFEFRDKKGLYTKIRESYEDKLFLMTFKVKFSRLTYNFDQGGYEVNALRGLLECGYPNVLHVLELCGYDQQKKSRYEKDFRKQIKLAHPFYVKMDEALAKQLKERSNNYYIYYLHLLFKIKEVKVKNIEKNVRLSGIGTVPAGDYKQIIIEPIAYKLEERERSDYFDKEIKKWVAPKMETITTYSWD